MKFIIVPWVIFLSITVPQAITGQTLQDRSNQLHFDFQAEGRKTSFPEIKWKFPKSPNTNSKDIKVNVKATISSNVALKSVKLAVLEASGRDTIGIKKYSLKHGTKHFVVDQNVFLNSGKSKVELNVRNKEGGMVTGYRFVNVGMDAIKDALSSDRKDYALIFATDQYNNWPDLANPVLDAETIGRMLKRRYGFEVELVKNFKRKEVYTKIREYSQKSYQPQDQLFIFFAGHGQFDDTFNEGYVVAENSLAEDPGKNSYISHNRLRAIINNIPSKHIFLAMDVCYGGSFNQKLIPKRGVSGNNGQYNNNEFIVRKLSITTRKYLTSGGIEYVSDGIPGNHSPFARKFIQALKTNGGRDGILTLAELKVFMQKLSTTPRFGGFGIDEHGSEFLFIAG